jgi:protein-S-isoprenylcysteine O-methyltransferase Ste14
MALFGILHSWLAGQNIKQAIRQRLGERVYQGFYRLGYNALAVATLGPVGVFVLLNPGQVIWQADGVARLLMILIQLAGVIGIVVSLLQIDFWRFAGLRQAKAYLNNQPLPLPDEPLQTRGLYGFVRHPLYLFSLMVIWPLSPMTESWLAFNFASTLYFTLGSLLEERRLIAAYGKTYLEYRQRVPWLVPFLRMTH